MLTTRTKPLADSEKSKLERFVKAAKKVKWLASFCIRARSYIKNGDSSSWSFLQMMINLQAESREVMNRLELLGKNKRPKSTTKWKERRYERLRFYLQTPPTRRTAADVQQIYGCLRSHPAMQEFPVDIQQEMCKHMFWQHYKARQVIYREGGPMDCFYIIIHGVVLLNKMHENESYNPHSTAHVDRKQYFPITVEELSDGRSFGSDTDDHKRRNTVVCKTDVHLLLLENESYSSIIREPFKKKRQEDVSIIRGLPFFGDYPVNDLYSCDPTVLYSCYYTPGSVVIDDIMTANSFIIVKSGRCRLLMKLDDSAGGQSPRFPPVAGASPRDNESETLKELFPLYCEDIERQSRYRCSTRHLHLKTEELRADVFSQLSERPLSRLTSVASTSALMDRKPSRQTIRRKSSIVYPQKTASNRSGLNHSNTLIDLGDLPKDRFVPTVYVPEGAESKRMVRSLAANDDPAGTLSAGNSIARYIASQKTARPAPSGFFPIVEENAGKLRQGHTASVLPRSKWSETESNEKNDQLVQLAMLERGAIFGIESLVHHLPHQLSVVSEGCECIHFNKRFFVRTATSSGMQKLVDSIIAFPNTEFCVSHVQREHEWSRFKRALVSELHSYSLLRKSISKT